MAYAVVGKLLFKLDSAFWHSFWFLYLKKNSGKDPLPDKVDDKDINSVAGVLKLYFRELKEPLFPTHIFDDLMACSSQHNFNSQYYIGCFSFDYQSLIYNQFLLKAYANKSAFSLVPRLSTWHCPHLLLSAVLRRRCCWTPAPKAIDWYLLPTGRSAANGPATAGAVDLWDRRTDARPLHRPCPAYCAGNVKIS